MIRRNNTDKEKRNQRLLERNRQTKQTRNRNLNNTQFSKPKKINLMALSEIN
jgi:hypothetical protein